MRVRLTPRCLPSYLIALLNGPIGRDQIETAARTAVGTFKINNQQVRQLCFAFPPVEEQQQILEGLSAELRIVTTTVQRARDEISLLREYRTRLIADVVTGKLDVREAAAKLPDEPDEAESLDDADAVVENDDDAEDADFDDATAGVET